jgi:hypothetical protein
MPVGEEEQGMLEKQCGKRYVGKTPDPALSTREEAGVVVGSAAVGGS